MDDFAITTLSDVLKRYGAGLIDDPPRLEGFLRDLCGTRKVEIHVLVNAARLRIPQELRMTGTLHPLRLIFPVLVRRLESELALTPEAAQWAVNGWAQALGLPVSAIRPDAAPSSEIPTKPRTGTSAPVSAPAPASRPVSQPVSRPPSKPGAASSNAPTNAPAQRWLPAYKELSRQQQQVISASLQGSTLVQGPAGSGKTAVTLHRAKILNDQGLPFTVFVYTRVLLSFIKAAARDLGLPPDNIHSLYSWVYKEYKSRIGAPSGDDGPHFDRWADDLSAFYDANPRKAPHFEYVLVDGGQDFAPNVADLLHRLTGNLFVAGDSAQAIHQSLSGPAELNERWQPLKRVLSLTENYRTPQSAARLAALFMPGDEQEPEAFIASAQGRTAETLPLYLPCTSADQQSDEIAAIVRSARPAESVGILLKNTKQVEAEAARLRQRGLRLRVALAQISDFDFDDPAKPTITTIHSAAGLEFDHVILPDLTADLWNARARDPKEERLFFTALTRTRRRLVLLAQRGRECAYLQRLLRQDEPLLDDGSALNP